MNRETKNWRIWIAAGLAVVALGIGLFAGQDTVARLVAALRSREAAAVWLSTMGPWGPPVYVAVLVAQVFTAVVPGHALLVAAGYVYGFKAGLLLNILGEIGGSQVVFWLARRQARPRAYRLLRRYGMSRWITAANRLNITFFLVCFWVPVIPSNAANYLAGLSRLSFPAFLFANLVGRLPGLTMATLIGSHGLEFSWTQWAGLAILGAVAIISGRILTPRLERRFLNRRRQGKGEKEVGLVET